ncbi:potassium channel family protein [Levilactobacillus tangyuanensis]|uniref:Potassium channel family protein n=1 Tax=Levilactobacillus tangyuanensis TaxID=2486021 RepID=A0ABW1TQ64_9LACO
MMARHRVKKSLIAYHVIVTVLTFWSVGNVLLMLLKFGDYHVEARINNGLLIAFALDYLWRLIHAHDRKIFLIQSTFDLLGIIPMHPVFAFFRLGRLVRLIRFHHLFWKMRIAGKWTRIYHRFIYKTGFIYLFSISVAIIVLSAFLFSISEKQTLGNSLWWAITTATTVGYGDETPHTAFGKIVASFLMVGGIGFIGLLTSTITGFITKRAAQSSAAEESQEKDELPILMAKIDTLTGKVDDLQTKLDALEKPDNKKTKS